MVESKTFNFTFKVAKPKKVKKTIVTVSKLVTGVCFKDENNVWKIRVSMDNSDSNPSLLILEFTERSHNIKNKTILFNHCELGKTGLPTKYIMPTKLIGLKSNYSPFCEDYEYSGYLVRIDGKLYFDVTNLLGKIKFKLNDEIIDEVKTPLEIR